MPLHITEPKRDDKETGETERYMHGVIERYMETLAERTKFHFGYPYNLDFDFGSLFGLQRFSINNLGDPFVESNYGVHSRPFEVGVLEWFARLWEIEEGEYWGYVTNCGTEGNLHGILLGRETFPDGVLFASESSHYSVFKAARLFRMDCVKVKAQCSGEIDYDDLRKKIRERADKPVILSLNIGTTVKGAVDDLDRVLYLLKHDLAISESDFFIHCDGALFGLMMPFVKQSPKVTFKKPISSISVSGHKFIGCPMPCGIQMCRLSLLKRANLSQKVEYVSSNDSTIMGSRNGHAPIFLWYTLNKKGYRGFRDDVQRCLKNAVYLRDRLKASKIGVMLNPLSNTVVFERPKDEAFIHKWQLACEGNIAHAVVMPSVSRDKIDSFVEEMVAVRDSTLCVGRNGIASHQNAVIQTSHCSAVLWSPTCIAGDVGVENCACVMHFTTG